MRFGEETGKDARHAQETNLTPQFSPNISPLDLILQHVRRTGIRNRLPRLCMDLRL